MNKAASLYRKWAIRILHEMYQIKTVDIAISYCPSGEFQTPYWMGVVNDYFEQKGDSLSDRLTQAFQYGFNKQYSSVIAIGTDSPDLPYEYVNSAFNQLRLIDVVLGPSIDGGYYLVGLNTLHPEIFQNILFLPLMFYVKP